VIQSLGLDAKKIDKCMGDPNADAENPVLKQEQDAQVGHGSRGDVTILPTLIINNRQYRGKLDKGAVLKAVCAGFQETTEPTVCLSEDMETNECLKNNGGCWHKADVKDVPSDRPSSQATLENNCNIGEQLQNSLVNLNNDPALKDQQENTLSICVLG
jgi:hypothetical protein